MNGVKERELMTDRLPPTTLDPVIEEYKKGVDLTLIRENLRLSIDQRFLQLIEHQRLAEELRQAGRRVRQTQ
jgi:hypothetical protein